MGSRGWPSPSLFSPWLVESAMAVVCVLPPPLLAPFVVTATFLIWGVPFVEALEEELTADADNDDASVDNESTVLPTPECELSTADNDDDDNVEDAVVLCFATVVVVDVDVVFFLPK